MTRDGGSLGSVRSAAGTHRRLHEDFDLNDVNRDGQLTLGEFIHLMHNRDVAMTAEECQVAFDEIDTNRDGLIDFARFLLWWTERLSGEGVLGAP
jgi:Ca2+-binding EF-hand superfamily protein